MQAIFDVWFLGDQFLKHSYNVFVELNDKAIANEQQRQPRPYLFEYYNIIPFYERGLASDKSMIRIVNSLVEALCHNRLPRFLVVIIDKDLSNDLDVFDEDVVTIQHMAINWLVCQIHMLVRRKRAELLEKKPGAIFTGDPVIIFTRMI